MNWQDGLLRPTDENLGLFEGILGTNVFLLSLFLAHIDALASTLKKRKKEKKIAIQ